ncbi:MAG: hydrogenase assembly protein HypC [Thiobacillus sp. SCN 64-317]|nr:HypC/HybG/HupF family hydrogenase formation chaperone [Thiobacillus sp.]ODV11154.1 MAG: hydrogenase assembly protein HypC [Thiobacillus sp. SCN 64-317]
MCLAIPMRIESIDGFIARCQAKGVWRDVSLFMMQDAPPAIGDFVMVHVGYAIQTITESDAHSTWELLDQILEGQAREVGGA